MRLMQAFIKDVMDVDVMMEPNFENFSCQVLFIASKYIDILGWKSYRNSSCLENWTERVWWLQFNFGVPALPRDQDPGFQTGCLSICPTAAARATLRQNVQSDQCPQVHIVTVAQNLAWVYCSKLYTRFSLDRVSSKGQADQPFSSSIYPLVLLDWWSFFLVSSSQAAIGNWLHLICLSQSCW
jgi:hypothetical protein